MKQEHGVMFNNNGTGTVHDSGTTLVNQGNGKTKNKDITCYTCGEKGHITPNCPNKNKNKSTTTPDNVGHNMLSSGSLNEYLFKAKKAEYKNNLTLKQR